MLFSVGVVFTPTITVEADNKEQAEWIYSDKFNISTDFVNARQMEQIDDQLVWVDNAEV
jgi:hypothetical protein